jgi:hypothetical protein
MSMPPQLARADRPRKSTRPIAEQLPSISINDLGVPSPYDYKTYVLPNISFRYPHLASVKVSNRLAEFILPSLHRGENKGPAYQFRLKPIRTGFGIRYAFVCHCQRPVIKLYHLHRQLACFRCCRARYASQTCDKRSRPILQASRIQSFLDNKPRLLRRTRERLQKRLGEKVMIAQRRFGTHARSLWD